MSLIVLYAGTETGSCRSCWVPSGYVRSNPSRRGRARNTERSDVHWKLQLEAPPGVGGLGPNVRVVYA